MTKKISLKQRLVDAVVPMLHIADEVVVAGSQSKTHLCGMYHLEQGTIQVPGRPSGTMNLVAVVIPIAMIDKVRSAIFELGKHGATFGEAPEGYEVPSGGPFVIKIEPTNSEAVSPKIIQHPGVS